MKVLNVLTLTYLSFCFCVNADTKLVVVVNINNPTDEITKKQLIDLYMGKYVAFPDGRFATPLDLLKNSKDRKTFYKTLTGSPISQINAYWSRIKFTGRASEPQKINSEQVVNKVSTSKNVIGYLQESLLTDQMKVIYKIDR